MPENKNRTNLHAPGFRYMGTKRQLAPTIARIIRNAVPYGPILDAFGGMGAVAEQFKDERSVYLNDRLSFTLVFANVRFCATDSRVERSVWKRFNEAYRYQKAVLMHRYRARIHRERVALRSDKETLRRYMAEVEHPGNSSSMKEFARVAESSPGPVGYQLATLYYSGAYFGAEVAIQLDALRFAIDGLPNSAARDRFVAAWLCAANVVINAPGHSAQYLKPSGEQSARRLRASWSRDAYSSFLRALDALRPLGRRQWRMGNRTYNMDAIKLIRDHKACEPSVIYADPPYTRDCYDRYYHLYETLYRYQYPDSLGAGRYPRPMDTHGFTRKTEVAHSFDALAAAAARRGSALVLSYPENGLAVQRGTRLTQLLRTYFADVRYTTVQHTHSSLAGGGQAAARAVQECIYVCQ